MDEKKDRRQRRFFYPCLIIVNVVTVCGDIGRVYNGAEKSKHIERQLGVFPEAHPGSRSGNGLPLADFG